MVISWSLAARVGGARRLPLIATFIAREPLPDAAAELARVERELIDAGSTLALAAELGFI
jgi:hypothetical protein